jgi:hypothetical protein
MTSHKVLVSWKTADEANTDRFEIEHHTGNGRFIKTGTIAAVGQGTGNYTFTHEAHAGNNFYRLKMIDLDGKFTYSATRQVQMGAALEILSILPNPVVGKKVNVKWTGSMAGRTILSVLDGTGRIVYTTTLTSPAQAISTQGWASGLYEVVLYTAAKKVYAVKVMIP